MSLLDVYAGFRTFMRFDPIIEVREVWGVGPRWAKWLEDRGIATALALKRADPKAIRRKMTVVGERLVYELNGKPCLPLELVAPPRQGPHGVALIRPDVDGPAADQGGANPVRGPGCGEAQAPAAD